jgi:hypothetical protein
VNIGGIVRGSLRRLGIDPGGESMAQFRRQMMALSGNAANRQTLT